MPNPHLTEAEEALRQALVAVTRAQERVRQVNRATADVATPASRLPANVTTPGKAPEGGARFFRDGEEGYGRMFDWLRSNPMLGPKISKEEFEGCDIIISAFGMARAPISYVAYGLATAYLETAHTMQPIAERGGNSYFTRQYDIRGRRPNTARRYGNTTPGDGIKYRGRGYVQLTWKINYERAARKLRELGFDVDLVANPDLAMRPDVAAAVMVYGMIEGWFTGRKLSDDLPRQGPATIGQFVASRDIINGSDKQDQIAVYANDFQTALQHGGYMA